MQRHQPGWRGPCRLLVLASVLLLLAGGRALAADATGGAGPAPRPTCAEFHNPWTTSTLPSKLGPSAAKLSTPPPATAVDLSSWNSGVKVFVGIFTNLGAEPAAAWAAAQVRRNALRRTWLRDASPYDHLLVRFVVGRPEANHSLAANITAEMDTHTDFLVLPTKDCFKCNVRKAYVYFAEVFKKFPNVQWVVKATDGVYMNVQRLLMAADQWTAMGADYTGCLGYRPVIWDFKHPRFEKNFKRVSARYPLAAIGYAYALSGRIIRTFFAPNVAGFRTTWAYDDVAIGMCMVANTGVVFDDRRLCSSICHPHAVAVANVSDRFVLSRTVDLDASHADNACTCEATWPPPYWSHGLVQVVELAKAMMV